MCATVDHSVTYEVFGRKQTEAGKEFRDWLDNGRGILIVGGKNLGELTQNSNFTRWFVESRRSTNRIRQIDKAKIARVEERLRKVGKLRSNDGHVVALAVVSGARLLYTNDRKLTHDFENAEIVRNPGGEVFSTRESNAFTTRHNDLLNAETLCGDGRDG